MTGLSLATAARLLAMQQREFDNAGCSKSLARPAPKHGIGVTSALLIVAGALGVLYLL